MASYINGASAVMLAVPRSVSDGIRQHVYVLRSWGDTCQLYPSAEEFEYAAKMAQVDYPSHAIVLIFADGEIRKYVEVTKTSVDLVAKV